ncbi:hypothetical protein [Endozoicomonas arenosclerae]|uniref:hypothetical protein n=1 Tax=Endozoicomonas arenosclerae TaxID=1633495 RepID=UPI000781BCED|nr:hypothetical protein [Endozoicomonas arenosclerae]
MKKLDVSDLSNYAFTSKNKQNSELNKEQLVALDKLVDAQGNFSRLDAITKESLSTIQARLAEDPSIQGDAVLIDFSLRVLSIHKTWSFFFSDRDVRDIDPRVLDPRNVRLDKLINIRNIKEIKKIR